MRTKRLAGGGFTLVELIIVIVIIAILASIAAPNISAYLSSARRQSALSDAVQLSTALNIYNSAAWEALRVDGERLAAMETDELRAALSETALMPRLSFGLEAAARLIIYTDGMFEPDNAEIDAFMESFR